MQKLEKNRKCDKMLLKKEAFFMFKYNQISKEINTNTNITEAEKTKVNIKKNIIRKTNILKNIHTKYGKNEEKNRQIINDQGFSIFLFTIIILIILMSLNSTNLARQDKRKERMETHYIESGLPVEKEKFKITSIYGMRINPVTKKASFHRGIDIGVKEGTNIYSVSDGIVTKIEFSGANGNTIEIKNGEYIYQYAHISPEYMVEKGEKILKGELIAKVGPKYIEISPFYDGKGYTNGLTTAPHLHFGVKYKDRYVNPLNVLNI